MSIIIDCIDDTEPVPRRLLMELTCDGPHHTRPLIPRAVARFVEPGPRGYGYPHMRREANAAGWRWANNGRILGPCCPLPPEKPKVTPEQRQRKAEEAVKNGDA